MKTCSGFGECLQQSDVPGGYTKLADMTCEHNCEPLKCPNFAVCGDRSPLWVHQCHGGRCLHCNMNFRKNLTFKETPEECPVCMEVSECVVLPSCTHTMCIPCFQRCYVNGPPKTDEPPFPYPEREDEYYDEMDSLTTNPVYRDLYYDPLVEKWNEDIERWHDRWDAKYADEENLRKCPICRA